MVYFLTSTPNSGKRVKNLATTKIIKNKIVEKKMACIFYRN